MNLNNRIMIIDFDNTLITCDSLFSSIFTLICKRRFFYLFNCFIVLIFKGKLDLKKYLFFNNLMTYKFSFNQKVINVFESNESMIVSASYDSYLKKALKKIIKKDKIIGSSSFILKGEKKSIFLINKYGYKNFDYIGDSISDIHVWKAARNAYTVKRLGLYKLFVPHLKHIDEL